MLSIQPSLHEAQIVREAFKLLKPGGRFTTTSPPSAFFAIDWHTKEFWQCVESLPCTETILRQSC